MLMSPAIHPGLSPLSHSSSCHAHLVARPFCYDQGLSDTLFVKYKLASYVYSYFGSIP